MIINVTRSNFAETAKGTILLDFWAPWCGPCKMIAPILEDIAAEDESLTIGKINVDEEAALAMEFGIASIPTLVLLEEGKPVRKVVGYRPKADILALLGK